MRADTLAVYSRKGLEWVRLIGGEEVAQSLGWNNLIEALREAFREGWISPARQHYSIGTNGQPSASLLVMPSWREGRFIGVKCSTVFPRNAGQGLETVNGLYILFDAVNGQVAAVLDAGELTARRTAAASALASSYLSRRDASRLLVVGTGRLAPKLAAAHAAVRPIAEVVFWGRRIDRAVETASLLSRQGVPSRASSDLQSEVEAADIISCATLSTAALVLGRWLKPGCHLDLVGSFTPMMREADDDALRMSRIFVDTRPGAEAEAGEIVQAMAAGVLVKEDIEADLFDLASEVHPGRVTEDEITLFKSVGASVEDLAAAVLCYFGSSSEAATTPPEAYAPSAGPRP